MGGGGELRGSPCPPNGPRAKPKEETPPKRIIPFQYPSLAETYSRTSLSRTDSLASGKAGARLCHLKGAGVGGGKAKYSRSHYGCLLFQMNLEKSAEIFESDLKYPDIIPFKHFSANFFLNVDPNPRMGVLATVPENFLLTDRPKNTPLLSGASQTQWSFLMVKRKN